jgi:hypothetical protein
MKVFYKKVVEAKNIKKRNINRGKTLTGLGSPRNREVCHSIVTALLENIANIGAQSTMKISIKMLQELSPHIPQKPSNGNISRSTNVMLHADLIVTTQ